VDIVPEPSGMTLLGLSTAGLAAVFWRRGRVRRTRQ
jgi:hypothetical protein